MEMEPTWRVKVPEISSPLAFMAGSQTCRQDSERELGLACVSSHPKLSSPHEVLFS
jgi:hypothetical protein